MSFAIIEQQVVAGFGLPAAIVIVALATALIFTVRLLLKAYDDKSAIQDQRIIDAKDFGTKLAEPLESLRIMTERQSTTTEKKNEILLDGRGK